MLIRSGYKHPGIYGKQAGEISQLQAVSLQGNRRH